MLLLKLSCAKEGIVFECTLTVVGDGGDCVVDFVVVGFGVVVVVVLVLVVVGSVVVVVVVVVVFGATKLLFVLGIVLKFSFSSVTVDVRKFNFSVVCDKISESAPNIDIVTDGE